MSTAPRTSNADWSNISDSPRIVSTERVSSPIFLVGAERSGTTLLRLMLDHHPEITWINEFSYAVDWVPGNGWPALESYRHWLEEDRVFKNSGMTIDPRLSYVELVNDFLLQWRRRSGKRIVGAQVHRRFDVLLRIWPDARFIHLVRDPRDVARSRLEMGWEGNVWYATDAWLEAENLWEKVRSQIPVSRQIDIHYESLIRNPKEQLDGICRLIGVDFDTSMLDYVRDTTYAPVDGTLSQQWRRKLSTWQVRLIEAKAAAVMERRGYELSGERKLEPGAPLRALLAMDDRRGRIVFRIRRYGFILWLSDVISRRTGPQAWRRKVGEKILVIDRGYIK